jgi:hypothetical protein
MLPQRKRVHQPTSARSAPRRAGGNGLHFLPQRRRFCLIVWRRFFFSSSVTIGTITPSEPM